MIQFKRGSIVKVVVLGLGTHTITQYLGQLGVIIYSTRDNDNLVFVLFSDGTSQPFFINELEFIE